MKQFFFTLTIICSSLILFGQSPVQQLTQQNFSPTSQIIRPFSLSKSAAKTQMVDANIIEDFQLLKLAAPTTAFLPEKNAKSLQLQIPIDATKELDLELIPSAYDPNSFKVFAGSDQSKYVKLSNGQHYWGRVKGDNQSVVALSIYDGEITGTINTADASYSISKLKTANEHILYQEKHLKDKPTFACYSEDIKQLKPSTKATDAKVFNANNAVRMYIEVDNDIYQDFGSMQATANYINAALNQVAVLYANESINLLINEMVIWNTPDPYTGPSTGNYLNQFQANLGGQFNGDLAHLIGNSGNGGVAYVNGICANKNFAIGYSGIRNSFQNVPAYSWTINVLTHEIGHNLGSPHTHSCSWNGNNTPIDGCGPASGNSEGCNGPIPTEGGTIMSYCHLTNVGINFNLGFGQQPGDLIRDIVYNAPCLTPAVNTCGDGIQNGNETGVDCGGSCPACPPSCTDGIQNGNETGIDCGGDCQPCPEACPGQTELTITIRLDNYPEETSWEIRNSANSIVASGGTYANQADGSTISISQCINDGCYTFIIKDTYGDGVCCSYGQGSYSLSDGTQILASGAAFTFEETTSFCIGNNGPTCNDGIQNGNETGVDCGGSDCAPCATCNDGIQNGNETGVDCGGSDCAPCATCNDGILNGNETGVDCGGSDCAPCATCNDGIQNGNETGVDCGGSDCAPCATCNDGILNGNETGVDCGGSDCAPCATCNDGIQNGNETGVDCGGSDCTPCATCNDGILNGNETGVDCGGSDCAPCATCNDGIQNGNETGVDCGGSDCTPCATCNDGIQNGNETGVDCGGSDCAPCATCNDGIQNGNETGVDCGGSDCAPCATCNDGILNGNETGVDCGGSDCAPCDNNTCTDVDIIIVLDNYPEETSWILKDDLGNTLGQGGTYGNLPDGSSVTISDCFEEGCYTFTLLDAYGDGICCGYGIGRYTIFIDGVETVSGGSFGSSESQTFCIDGATSITCNDGIQNGDETGIDCGGTSCAPCDNGICSYETVIDDDFEVFLGDWIDGGSDCRRSSFDAQYAASGQFCYRLRDNSSTSHVRSRRFELANAQEIIIEFSYFPKSMDNSNEGFMLEVSTDNGNSYAIIEDWYRGVDFQNDQRMFESVIYQGPVSDQMRFKFRCDASSNSDYVFIDDVSIIACVGDPASVSTNPDNSKPQISGQYNENLLLYPNPVDDEVSIQFDFKYEQSAQLSFFDLSGKVVYQQATKAYKAGTHTISVNTIGLREGMYYAVLSTSDEKKTSKFVIMRN